MVKCVSMTLNAQHSLAETQFVAISYTELKGMLVVGHNR